jgi:hypothetical protein
VTGYHRATLMNHIQDLSSIPLLDFAAKDSLFLQVDRGPDNIWEDSLVNILTYGLFWYYNKLSSLCVVADLANLNFVNPMERGWAPRTNDVSSGLTISPIIPHGVSDDELVRIYDEANRKFASYWNGNVYDCFPVTCVPVPCCYDDTQHAREETYAAEVKNFLHTKDPLSICRLILAHCDKRADLLSFVARLPCSMDGICSHCRSFESKSPKLLNCLALFQNRFPFPIDSIEFPGHKRTFLELFQDPILLPVLREGSVGQCDSHHYEFMSLTELVTHFSLFHGGIIPSAIRDKNLFVCGFIFEDGSVCKKSFPDPNAKQQHKFNDDHIRHRLIENDSAKIQVKTKRKRKMEENEREDASDEPIKLNAKVRIWFNDKRRYYNATVVKHNEKGYQVKYANGRKTYVELRLIDLTEDAKNTDRWNYL